MSSVIRWSRSRDNIVTLTIDDPEQQVNTVNDGYIDSLAESIDRLERVQNDIAGVILRSGKTSFLAGGDLNRLLNVNPDHRADFVADIDKRKGLTLRLESLTRPVVAIINGPALGGGLELALCCHRSIAIDDGRVLVGLPESRLGLIPGAGGIVRAVRRLGIDTALDALVLPGRKYTLSEALELGLIDAAASSPEDATTAAREWIQSHPTAPTRTAIPNLGLTRPLPPPNAVPVARAATIVANAAVNAPMAEALRTESEEFGDLIVSATTKNSIAVTFFASNALRKRAKALSAEPVDLRMNPTATKGLLGETADHLGDGQLFAEFWWDGSAEASALVAGLVRTGVVPVLVTERPGSFASALHIGLQSAITEQENAGVDPSTVQRALAWSGLRPPGHGEVLETVDDFDIELASTLLDATAAAGNEAVKRGVLAFPEDADGASVRIAAFPSWTGGIQTWLARGRGAGALMMTSQRELS